MVRDDERHLGVGRLIQRGFGSAQLARLQARVAELADGLIDAMLQSPDREGDLATQLAMPLTVRLMSVVLGAPEEDWPVYKQWADAYFFATNNQADLTAAKSMEMAERGLIPSLDLIGRELPEDFLSRFICDKVGDRALEDHEVLGLMLAIILGGSETTMSLIGNMMLRLLEVPSRWEAVKADPGLYDVAMEESLRLDPPVLGMMRAARHDVDVDGVVIPKDCKAFYNLSALNRDPAQFPEPVTFRLDRPRAQMRKHASFSGGMRLCLGAALVRVEVPTVLERLVARMPGLELAGEPLRAAGFNVWGPTNLPVRW